MFRLGLTALGIFLSIGCSPQGADTAQSYGRDDDPDSPASRSACASQEIPNQFIVQWKSGAVSVERNPNALMHAFSEQIEHVEPDYKLSIPEFNAHVRHVSDPDNWGAINVKAGAVWSTGDYGQGVTVAVVDTGVARSHPQLKPSLFINEREYGPDARGIERSSNHIDDDANGFVDDWNGFNFVSYNNDPDDDNGHGTHVSGVIAASHQDTVPSPGEYVQGLAPRSKILPLKFLDDEGSGSLSSAVVAIDYAVKMGAKVINASWGGMGCSATLKNRIGALVGNDVLFVAASGNDSVDLSQTRRYPASFQFLSQITVGAIDLYDSMADYSNFGSPYVHLFAPGSNIVSTYPGGSYASLSGTSMATPFVTGAAALYYSRFPNAHLNDVRNALFNSVMVDENYQNVTLGRLKLTSLLSPLTNVAR